MKKSMGLWQLVGFATTSLFGTILHFLYDWLGNSWWIAPFSGVNESTWEHMKLLFWPTFIFALLQSFFFKERNDFWCIKLRGILLGLTLIPIIFYTYNGVIGKSPDWVNIAIFFISALLVYVYEGRLYKSQKLHCKSKKIAIATLCLIAFLFVLFTFVTPRIGIFKDPLNGSFGIS